MSNTAGTTQNWPEVSEHLNTIELVYAEIGTPGYYCLFNIIRPLRDRYNKGERSRALAEEIMAVT